MYIINNFKIKGLSKKQMDLMDISIHSKLLNIVRLFPIICFKIQNFKNKQNNFKNRFKKGSLPLFNGFNKFRSNMNFLSINNKEISNMKNLNNFKKEKNINKT